MCTHLYLLKLGETVPIDFCVPLAAWCWGKSRATQQPTMDQTHRQTSQGVPTNHSDQPKSHQGALFGDVAQSFARSWCAPVVQPRSSTGFHLLGVRLWSRPSEMVFRQLEWVLNLSCVHTQLLVECRAILNKIASVDQPICACQQFGGECCWLCGSCCN